MSDLSNPGLESVGERLMTDWRDESVAEHLHRYAIALSLCAGSSSNRALRTKSNTGCSVEEPRRRAAAIAQSM